MPLANEIELFYSTVEMNAIGQIDFYLTRSLGTMVNFLLPSLFYPITIPTTLLFCSLTVYMANCIYQCVDESAKLQNNAASKLIHEMISTVSGVETIRAYRKQQMFLKRY